MLSADDLFRFFDYFDSHISNEKRKLNKTPTNTKIAQSFLSLVEKEHGKSASKEFLYTYYVFQFNYWDRLTLTGTSSYNNGIQLSFIIGKKAFERYKNRNTEYDWQLDSLEVIKKYGLK